MRTILSTLLSAALSGAVFAQVPSLINYQGRLTAANGSPVTGSKTFAISIYDAATGGNVLYTESIGAVTLDSNGVYSFQFGNAGTSNTQVTETIATADGTLTTFQKVLANSPVVAGTVSVTDGTYTWTQSAGSSNEDEFGVAYSNSLRRVTANYYAGAPTSGKTITATYRYGTSGISGALSSGAEHWMAVSVDGTPQATRQKVLAVPFASISNHAEKAESLVQRTNISRSLMSFSNSAARFSLPLVHSITSNGPSYNSNYILERLIDTHGISQICKIEATVSNNSVTNGIYVGVAQTSISLISISPTLGTTVLAQTSTNGSGSMLLNGPFAINKENEYLVQISLITTTTANGSLLSAGVNGVSSAIQQVKFVYDTE
jgi:hypothetical protein